MPTWEYAEVSSVCHRPACTAGTEARACLRSTAPNLDAAEKFSWDAFQARKTATLHPVMPAMRG